MNYTATRSRAEVLVLDKWTEAIVLEQGYSVDAINLNFAKAFDMVPHQKLLVKLAGYGMCCNGLQPSWRDDSNAFSSMIANRHGLLSRVAYCKEAYLGQCFLSATLMTCQMW